MRKLFPLPSVFGIMTHMNPVVHFEMPAEDTKRVSEFYVKTFGWNAQQMGADHGGYVVMQTGETDEKGMLKKSNMINGGFYPKLDDPKMNSTSVVIAVDNLTDHMQKVKDAGGTVLGEPMEIPEIGSYVSFLDTEGNRVGMLQPKERKM